MKANWKIFILCTVLFKAIATTGSEDFTDTSSTEDDATTRNDTDTATTVDTKADTTNNTEGIY